MEDIKKWAQTNFDIESVIIVGSYARETHTQNSDIDLCIITPRKAEMLENPDFVTLFGAVEKKQIEYDGACTSIRAWYADGKEVEFGIVEPTWVSCPLDQGTHDVLSGGYRVIMDKKNHFDNTEI